MVDNDEITRLEKIIGELELDKRKLLEQNRKLREGNHTLQNKIKEMLSDIHE